VEFATWDLVLFERFSRFWDLTTDFWAEIEEKSCKWLEEKEKAGLE
jgi:hypothetical protein